MTAIRAIGFDIGETLIFYRDTPMDWTARYPDALGAVAAALNFSPSTAQLADAQKILLQYNTRATPRTQEVSSEKIFSKCLGSWGLSSSINIATTVAAFFSFFRQALCPYPDAAPVLAQLKREDIPIGLLTDVPYGMPTDFVKLDLRETGLADSFDVLLTSVDVGYRKPHTAGLIQLSQKLGVHPRELLYVGNEPKDIQGAKAAGARSALIGRNNTRPDYGQDYTIHSLQELPDILAKSVF